MSDISLPTLSPLLLHLPLSLSLSLSTAALYHKLLADVYCAREELSNAVDSLRSALSLNPHDIHVKDQLADVIFEYSLSLSLLRRHSEAMALLDEASSLNPDLSSISILQKARNCIGDARYGDALSYIRTVLDGSEVLPVDENLPTFPFTDLHLHPETVLLPSPVLCNTLRLRVQIHTTLNSFSSIHSDLVAMKRLGANYKVFSHIHRLLHERLQSFLDLSVSHLLCEEYGKCAHTAKKVLEIDTTHVQGTILLAQAYQHMKRFDQASRVLEKALNDDRGNPICGCPVSLTISRGCLTERDGEESNLDACRLHQTLSSVFVAASVDALRREDQVIALALARKAVDMWPGNSDAIVQLAEVYFTRGDLTVSLCVMRDSGVDIASNYSAKQLTVQVSNTCGQKLYNTGDFDGAEKQFSNAISLIPTARDILFSRGKCRVQLNNLTGAYRDFQAAAQLGHGAAKSAFVRLHAQLVPSHRSIVVDEQKRIRTAHLRRAQTMLVQRNSSTNTASLRSCSSPRLTSPHTAHDHQYRHRSDLSWSRSGSLLPSFMSSTAASKKRSVPCRKQNRKRPNSRIHTSHF